MLLERARGYVPANAAEQSQGSTFQGYHMAGLFDRSGPQGSMRLRVREKSLGCGTRKT